MAVRFTDYSSPVTNDLAIDFDYNPADPGMAMILFASGLIRYRNNPPSVDDTRPQWFLTGTFPARRIKILDWTTGEGYVFDNQGAMHPLNGAPTISGAVTFTDGGGVDVSINPSNHAQAWILHARGSIHPVGGAPAPVGTAQNFSPQIGKSLKVDWATMNYAILDGYGIVHLKPGQNLGGQADNTGANNRPGINRSFKDDSASRIAVDFYVDDITGKWGGYNLLDNGGFSRWYTSPDAQPDDIQLQAAYFPNTHNFIRVKGLVGNSRIGVLNLDGRYWDYDIGDPVYAVTVSGPTGAQTTRKPTVTWNPTLFGGSASPPNRVWFKVFTSTVMDETTFDPNSSPTVYDSGPLTKSQTLAANNSMQIAQALPNGSFKVYVAVGYDDGSGVANWSRWTASPSIGILAVPPVPTNLFPANGATVNTDVPVVGCTLGPEALGTAVAAQYQLAMDSEFAGTAGNPVKFFSDQLNEFKASGVTSEKVPDAQELRQGTWFYRAREVSTSLDFGDWSAAVSFIVSHPPTTSNYSPTGGQSQSYEAGGVVTLHWRFSDSSPTDFQTAYQLVVEDNETGVLLANTGKVSSLSQSGPVVIPPTYANRELRWKVCVWDSDNVVGPFSTYNIFKVVESASVTITAPTGTVDNPQPTVTWTYSATGRVQVAYRVTITRISDSVQVYDSTQLQGQTAQHKLTHPVLQNDTDYSVAVTVFDNGGLGSTQIETFTTSWIPPDAASGVTVDGQFYEEQGFIRVDWNPLVHDDDYRIWRIYRGNLFQAFTNSYTLVAELDEGPFDDYSAPANETSYYAVVQVANRFGVDIESGKVPYEIATSGTHYWIVSNDNPTLSMRLPHVTADSYSEEYERESYVIKGRGRKVDRGVRMGVTGSLTAELRDIPEGLTARQQRQNIMILQSLIGDVYLRNPFGDVWKVSPPSISVERVPGVGIKEIVRLTIPYEEVV